MSSFIIQGKVKLRGEISVKGAKNNALKLIPAALLTSERVILHNVPNIIDVNLTLKLAKSLGAKIEKIDKNSISIQAQDINSEKN